MHPKIVDVDFSRLRVAIGGGAAVLPTTSAKWKALTGKHILEGYGLSETSPILTLNPATSGGFSATVGLPFPSTDIKLLDANDREAAIGEPGEVCAKGPQVMQGYWQNPQANAAAFTADGYFRTGDIGVFDAEGFLKIVDRKKDMIIVSGFNVFPNEAEAIAAGLRRGRRMRLRGRAGREDRRGGEAVRGQGGGRDAHRGRCHRALPAPACGLQGAEELRFLDALPKSTWARSCARICAGCHRATAAMAILKPQYCMATAPQFVGRDLGASDWVAVDQNCIDAFAACTGDRQWIHVDVERAQAREPVRGCQSRMATSPCRSLQRMVMQLGVILFDAATGLNYGLGKVRFIAPVKAGARVRTRASPPLGRSAQRCGRVLLKLNCTLEIEGETKPALVAELLSLPIGKGDAGA